MMEMINNQNPGLRRRFVPEQAFHFEDYTNSQLEKILLECCRSKHYQPSLEFREKALKKLEMQRRSEAHFGNAGSVQNLLKEAVSRATSQRKCAPYGSLKLESGDIELPGDDDKCVDLFEELRDLYRLENVIEELQKIKSQFDLAADEGEERPLVGHFVFSGAPGTGKTTVARCLGRILHRCGIIARPEVHETSGLKLTGEYSGQTKQVVEEHLVKAKGGILFIDEAYELGKGAYGSEACAALVEAMTNDNKYGGLVIIIAGYHANIQSMLDTNQGLKSRFNRFIDFPDWHSSDCTKFFQSKICANNISLEEPEQSMAIIEKGFKTLLPLEGWGNARDVTKFYESVSEYRAQRLHEDRALGNEESLGKIYLKKDITLAFDAMISARMGTGGARMKADARGDPFAELNKLYRMEKVKEKLQQLQDTYIIANQDGEDPPPLGHFIFTGSPGTGKTTVARVMSNILFDLELTARRHVEETSGLMLQGQYLGQTQKVVENILDKAKGGLLFIDEAYTLGQGMFGSEACNTLVAAMTDPRYAGVVVVIAGYPKDIDDMLACNAGFKSRFTHTLDFPDWDVNDCVQCFLERIKMKGFEIADGGADILHKGFGELQALDGFGNARDVDAVWRATCRFRASRVIACNDGRKRFEETDLQQATEELINSRSFAKGKQSMATNATLDQQLQTSQFMESEDLNYNLFEDAPQITQMPEKVEEVRAEEVDTERIDTGEYASQGVLQPANGRDSGVSDAVWAELQMAKQAEEKYLEKCLAEETERMRIQADIEDQLRLEQLATEAYEQKMRELQIQREMEAAKKRQKEKIQERLRAIGKCPMGFVWHDCGNGWRCAGGSHYVSDSELKKSFSYDM
ncbi:hypothetical protein ACHAW5_011038 [Stephanodiscus triporus]|uniref:AAA+ ATPase domain-containing protein n=1 Tax=Stephanodiscus triporus TaxID=2934178 RepID=A0ABD3PBT3_9STRA